MTEHQILFFGNKTYILFDKAFYTLEKNNIPYDTQDKGQK